ncbi:MAG TPA: hypothetical protein VHT34_02225 [Clostridia bacterium]|nr:hypothetical protein [Clostridia bacterium]
MKKKRSGFFTFIFSLLPGAGHMFMGFMKIGASMMSAFFLLIFISSWLEIGELMFVLPVLWFYSFFDCINKRYSTDEEFALIEDRYLFSFDKLVASENSFFGKKRLFAGLILLLLGIYLLWNNFMYILQDHISSDLYNTIRDYSHLVPQIILGGLIIMLGIRLILGKKKECDENA